MKSNFWLLLYCTYRLIDWIFFQMFEHRWKKQPLISVLGRLLKLNWLQQGQSHKELYLVHFQQRACGFVSPKRIYVILVLLRNNPKIQGIVLLLFLAWMVCNWKNICRQALKVPSHYHSPDFARSWTAWSVPNIKTRSSSPWPLSKSKNCSSFSDRWCSRGNTGISAFISGFGGWCPSFLWCIIVFPLFSLGGRLAMVAADIFANSLAMMCCGGSSDVSAVSLILLFTLVNSTLTCRGGCFCSFNYAITLSPKSSLIFALHRPFLFNSQSYELTSFARSFWKTYINSFIIIFCFLFCEETNSIISIT